MLKGLTAVVTGASRGIGAAIAAKLASLGADIAVIYAGNAAAAQAVCESAAGEYGVKALPFCCDVADFEAVRALSRQVRAEFGRVDILVNNAGITRDGIAAVMREEDFDAVVDINLKGAFNTVRHFTPLMLRSPAGRIINISSIAGIMGNAGQVNYAASKAGLIGLTKSVARELAARGITCNAIAPGFIRTDMTRDIGEGNALAGQIPLGHMGEAEDVAGVAAFLAGPGGAYITGEVIRVDGGLAM